MAEGEQKEKQDEGKKIVHTYPLIRVSHDFIDQNNPLIMRLNIAFRYAGRNETRSDGISGNCMRKTFH